MHSVSFQEFNEFVPQQRSILFFLNDIHMTLNSNGRIAGILDRITNGPLIILIIEVPLLVSEKLLINSKKSFQHVWPKTTPTKQPLN